ncbi:MAG TPA: hypothetical protein VES79_12110 [Solirubrobacteraceae bacterium]|nr:hypothetical protein [Solirubrobacteraceae bacterium]
MDVLVIWGLPLWVLVAVGLSCALGWAQAYTFGRERTEARRHEQRPRDIWSLHEEEKDR